ncbi:hypothetical protein CF326_g5191 [Tilletia indica]|nr:hypothetical protein CF326_g5191 [Tilletia indica]
MASPVSAHAGERVLEWADNVSALPDVAAPVEDLPSSPIVPEIPAPIVSVDDRPERVDAYVARYNHVDNYPQGYHGRPMSNDPHVHPLWKCPLVEMNARRRYEEFFIHLDHQVGRIDRSWSRYDLLKMLQNTVAEGLNILPAVDGDMRENLRGGDFGDERCFQLGHSPYPFRGDAREELPGIARRQPHPLPEPAVSETGLGEEDPDEVEALEPWPVLDAVIASPNVARAVTPSVSPDPEVRGLGVVSPLASPATLALGLVVEMANVEQARAALADDDREDALLAQNPGVLSQSSSASGSGNSASEDKDTRRDLKRDLASAGGSVGGSDDQPGMGDQENASGSTGKRLRARRGRHGLTFSGIVAASKR